ncbi:MAG TPA: AAA family ATPase, partial [Candidatus Acidoferrales bacterium]|nr:AAA family ATPase [Candidatus Acidoferrales bacterium]
MRCPVLVGRRSELDLLERALSEARRGHGSTVLIAGDAGIGKTRLSAELQASAQAQGAVTLWGGCSEADLSLPYLPIVEAVGNHLAQAGFDTISQRLGPAGRELGALFPQFGAGGPEVTEASQARLRLFDAVLQLLVLVAGQSGLLLVVEDFHWADVSTRELIDFLARRVRSCRMLMLVTYRSDEMHRRHPLLPLLQGWRRSGLATGVDLAPLPPDAVATMVKETLGAREVRDETRDFLYQRSEGNPFVVEELVKAALDRGDFYRTAEGWSRRELSEIRLPETVRDSVLLRVERLDPSTVELVRAAAVLGTSFNHRHLAAMSGLDTAGLRAAVEQCFREQLLEDDPHEQDRFRFRHALTREAVYDDLIAPERERLHERAADV